MQSLFGKARWARADFPLRVPVRDSERKALSAPAIERSVTAQVVAEIHLTRSGNLLLRIEQHFFPLGDPSGRTRNSEQYREHGHRETHRLIDQARVEIHVGVKAARNEVIVFERDPFALECNFD